MLSATTPAVLGIRLVLHPLLEKRRGVCFVPNISAISQSLAHLSLAMF